MSTFTSRFNKILKERGKYVFSMLKQLEVVYRLLISFEMITDHQRSQNPVHFNRSHISMSLFLFRLSRKRPFFNGSEEEPPPYTKKGRVALRTLLDRYPTDRLDGVRLK